MVAAAVFSAGCGVACAPEVALKIIVNHNIKAILVPTGFVYPKVLLQLQAKEVN